jgi:hypothetical protein
MTALKAFESCIKSTLQYLAQEIRLEEQRLEKHYKWKMSLFIAKSETQNT